ncbi:MAG: glycosyltransferase family 4 protein [Candidatus Woesearchaeota archaeon]
MNKIKPEIFINSDHLVFNKVKCPTYAVGWDYPKGIFACIRLATRYEEWWKLPYRIFREIEMSIKDYLAFSQVKSILGVTDYVTNKLQKKGYPAILCSPGIKIKSNDEKKCNKFTIVFVGRNHIWTKRKGLIYLLDALKILENENPEYDLIILGNIPKESRKRFERYNSIKRHIILKGVLPRKDFINIIKRSHILAAPSLYEEFGFSIIEAMSQGLPVIVSRDNPSFKEMVSKNAGIELNIHNPKDFSERISGLMNNKKLYTEIKNSAIIRIKERYSWNQIIPLLEKFQKSKN